MGVDSYKLPFKQPPPAKFIRGLGFKHPRYYYGYTEGNRRDESSPIETWLTGENINRIGIVVGEI